MVHFYSCSVWETAASVHTLSVLYTVMYAQQQHTSRQASNRDRLSRMGARGLLTLLLVTLASSSSYAARARGDRALQQQGGAAAGPAAAPARRVFLLRNDNFTAGTLRIQVRRAPGS
jgi:hypothetical protein